MCVISVLAGVRDYNAGDGDRGCNPRSKGGMAAGDGSLTVSSQYQIILI